MERMAELYHQLYGVDYAALRFFSVYGPHEVAKGSYANMVSQFLWTMQEGKGTGLSLGMGSQTRDFIFVKDVTAAMSMAAEKGAGSVQPGDGQVL